MVFSNTKPKSLPALSQRVSQHGDETSYTTYVLYLQDFTRSYKILQDLTRFYKILQDFTRFYKILQDFTRFYKILQDFTRFYLSHSIEPSVCLGHAGGRARGLGPGWVSVESENSVTTDPSRPL